MEPSQQGPRQTAAEAFMESLNQLEQSLRSEKGNGSDLKLVESCPAQSSQPLKMDSIDVAALEEAAADIEQFMQMDDSSSA